MSSISAGVTAAGVGVRALNLPQRMERLPLTRYQRTIFLIIATAWLFDSMDLAMMTFVLAPISTDFKLDAAASGFLGSASLAGMVIGAGGAGMLADRIGRKLVFQSSMIMWGFFSILCAFAPDLNALVVFRFLLGIGIGAEFPIGQSLVSEFIPAKQRGKYIALLEGFWPIGFIVAGVVSLILIPMGGWRWVFIAEGLPAVWLLIIRRRVPESPRWLESRGRFDEAEATMVVMEKEVEKAYGKPLPAPSKSGPADEIGKGGFSLWELLSPRFRKATIGIWILWFAVLLGYYGVTTWMGKLLVDNGFTVQKSIQFVLLMTLWGVPGFFSAAYLVEKLGRKPAVSGFILCSAAASFFYGQAHSETMVYIAGAVMQFFLFGVWSVLYAYTPEQFPTRARATACGTASSWGRVGSLIGPILVPTIMAGLGVSAVFTLAAGAYIVGAASVLILGVETKGKVLEEIAS